MLASPVISAVVCLVDTNRAIHLDKRATWHRPGHFLPSRFTASCYLPASLYDLRNMTGSYSCDRCCKTGCQKIFWHGSEMEVTKDACLLGNKQIRGQVSINSEK